MLAVVSVCGSVPATGETGTSVYSNPKFEVSFRYPHTYQLLTGQDANLSWGYMGEVQMNFLRPGGVAIAAVQLPENSYPGTDFTLGFFRVSLNSQLDASACDLFASTSTDQAAFPPPASKKKVGANEFMETEDGEAAMMKQASSQYYHIFRNGVCYEFELGLGTAGFGAVDGLKQVDGDDVFRKLEAILATVAVKSATATEAAETPTPIRSFDATLVKSAKPTTYEVSWDAQSAPTNTIQLKIACGDNDDNDNNDLNLWESAPGENKETPLKCGDSISLSSNNGVLLLRFRSTAWAHPELILAAGAGASKTRTLEVPPSPSIRSISAGECEDDDNGPLMPGYEFLISGNGLTKKNNTIMLGSTRLGVSVSEEGRYLDARLPASVAPGKYELSVENALGATYSYPVVVAAPPPPQNVGQSKPGPIYHATEQRLPSAPWPMLGAKPEHSGLSPYGGAPKTPTLRWKFPTALGITAPPVIDRDGVVYVGSGDKHLYAINPDGSQKWNFRTCEQITSSPSLGSDGTIYVTAWDEKLYAINSDDGTLQWKLPVGSVESSPTVGKDGTVYTLCGGDLCAINPSGNQKWRFKVGSLTKGTPAIDKDANIYVGGVTCNDQNVCSGDLYSVNPNGTQKWRFATAGTIRSSPVIGPDGTIYVSDSKRDESLDYLPSDIYAVKPNGSLKWKFSAGERASFLSTPAIGSDGALYVTSGDCNLYVINPTGDQKWTLQICQYGYSGGPLIPSAVLDADGTIYVGSIESGPMYKLLAIGHDGQLRWTYDIGASHSSVPRLTSAAIGADGTIYLASNDYSLYAIGKPLNAPAPTPVPVAGKITISPATVDFGPPVGAPVGIA